MDLKMTRDQILKEFEKARESYVNKGAEWQMKIMGIQVVLNGAVRNMDWVNLFTWILPVADKEHADEYRTLGRMITAIYYIEIMSKQGYDYEYRDLKRIEAGWRDV